MALACMMTLLYAEKCCHLVIAHEASARRICISVRQFLIHSALGYLFVISVRENVCNLSKNVKSYVFWIFKKT